jgi:cation-transporting ATPase 13A1
MIFLSFVIREEKPADVQVEDDEQEKFVPSLLNSTVYIISMALQVSTFAINYRVRPSFMFLEENRLKEEGSFNRVARLLCSHHR